MGRPKKNASTEVQAAEMKENEMKVQAADEEIKTADTNGEKTLTVNGADEKSDAEPQTAPTFTQEQVQAMIAEAVAQATEKLRAQQAPQVVQIAQDVEKVQFLWMAEVSDENIYEIGPNGMYGRIVGKTGAFMVPKSDISRVMDALFRLLMQKRWIIVVDGLTDDERQAYGVDYKEGELLDKKAFAKMVELGDKMLEIYPKLCAGHREMVAKRYHEAFASHSRYVTRDLVVELNVMSKRLGSEQGDFTDIIEIMNEEDKNRK